jgi:STE24 endopeptidase
MKLFLICVLTGHFLWGWVLDRLNSRYINGKTDELDRVLPKSLLAHIDRGEYVKMVQYTEAKTRFGSFQSAVGLLVSILVIHFSLLRPIDLLVQDLPIYRIVFLLIVIVIGQVFEIPFDLYRVFVLEKRFGFNQTTPKVFVLDLLKSTAVSICLLTPLLWLLFVLYDAAGSRWWIWGFMLFSGFQFLMLILYPLLIAPLFNRFEPMQTGELLDDIHVLTKKVCFPLQGVFVMDGSKHSRHSNAYFTGIGRSKRVVLYDTLVDALSNRELLAVLAHELGHYKLHHVKIQLSLTVVSSFIGFYLLNVLLGSEPFFQSMGYDGPAIHIGLILLMFFLSPIGMVLGPLANVLSRRFEYAADTFANRAMGQTQSLTNALITLNKDNLSVPVVHPLYSFVHYSHPPLAERLLGMETKEP